MMKIWEMMFKAKMKLRPASAGADDGGKVGGLLIHFLDK